MGRRRIRSGHRRHARRRRVNGLHIQHGSRYWISRFRGRRRRRIDAGGGQRQDRQAQRRRQADPEDSRNRSRPPSPVWGVDRRYGNSSTTCGASSRGVSTGACLQKPPKHVYTDPCRIVTWRQRQALHPLRVAAWPAPRALTLCPGIRPRAERQLHSAAATKTVAGCQARECKAQGPRKRPGRDLGDVAESSA